MPPKCQGDIFVEDRSASVSGRRSDDRPQCFSPTTAAGVVVNIIQVLYLAFVVVAVASVFSYFSVALLANVPPVARLT